MIGRRGVPSVGRSAGKSRLSLSMPAVRPYPLYLSPRSLSDCSPPPFTALSRYQLPLSALLPHVSVSSDLVPLGLHPPLPTLVFLVSGSFSRITNPCSAYHYPSHQPTLISLRTSRHFTFQYFITFCPFIAHSFIHSFIQYSLASLVHSSWTMPHSSSHPIFDSTWFLLIIPFSFLFWF